MTRDRHAGAMVLAVLAAAIAAGAQAPPPLAERIGHTDPSRYRRSRSHGSEGDMACMTLVPRNAIPLLNFAHRCQMTAPKGGVGHHFHNRTEEMFVIFDGDAEFTIDGRTSRLKGTVGAPVRMGHSQYVDHLILTPGSSEGLHSHASVGEVYYVLDGEGQVTVAGESAAIGKGDGVPIVPDQAHAVANTGPRDLELMIIGIATEKGQLDTVVLK